MDLQEIKEREAKATKGPWVHLENTPFWGEIRTANEEAFTQIAVMPHLDDRTDDFNFIAYAREDIPALVAEVERLRKGVTQVENKNLDLYVECEELQEEIERLQAENKQLKNELERAKEACNFLCDWEEKALEADAIGDNHPLYKSIQIQAGIAGAKAVSIASQITGRTKKDEISNQ